MSEQEAIDFLKGMCIIEDPSDAKLKELWLEARAAVEVSPTTYVIPEVLDIDDRHKAHLEAVAKNPTFPETVGHLKWSFKSVEIDKLVCFQKYVDTDYSSNLKGNHVLSDMNTLLDFCLPRETKPRLVGTAPDPGQNAITLFSSTLDFRILGMAQSQDPSTKRRVYGFITGFGVPFIQVAKLEDRYILKNGYHRLYAVRKDGVRHAPCVVVEAATYAEAGGQKAGFFPESLVMSAHPPTFSCFLDNKVSPQLKMWPATKVIRIRADEFVIPGIGLPALSPSAAQTVPSSLQTAKADTRREQELLKPERESWNVYGLEDGTVLKVCQLLMGVSRQLESEEAMEMMMELSNVFIAMSVPAGLKGLPSTQQYSQPELTSAVEQRDLKYETIRENVNEYRVGSDQRLGLSVSLVNVSRTSRFDASGNPVYLVNTQVSIQPLPA